MINWFNSLQLMFWCTKVSTQMFHDMTKYKIVYPCHSTKFCIQYRILLYKCYYVSNCEVPKIWSSTDMEKPNFVPKGKMFCKIWTNYLLDNHTSVCKGMAHGLFIKNFENLWWLSAVEYNYKQGYKPCNLLWIWFLSLAKTTAFRLEHGCVKSIVIKIGSISSEELQTVPLL